MKKKNDKSFENNDDKMVCETDYQSIVENFDIDDERQSFENHITEMIKKTIEDNR